MFKSNNTYLAVFIGILGVVFFSAKAVMVKLAYHYDVSSVNLLMFRMLFALPCYVVVLYFIQSRKRVKSPVNFRDVLWLLFFGFIGYYLASYFDFLGLQYIKASIERVILFIYPTIVVLLSAIFLKRKINPLQILAIVITYIGVFVAFWDEFKIEGTEFLIGAGLIFLSALTYASYLTGSDFLIPKFGVLRFTSYAMIIACICVLAHYFIVEETSLFGYHENVYWLGLAMAILSTVIPSFMVSYCIKEIGASNFSILGSLGPVSTIILANIFLGERFSTLQMGGTLIVIFGVVIISFQKNVKTVKN
ncbi:DMT family transporter [Zhouia amylolytica]|uniref:Putative permease, DMT superfamily n=1 Tax=Zhouia amylolytica AD3 TaxID=1286632 RepID=W2UPL1_9FLAO|nr:DMT family transporter [Zhouia amylolytica]ETN95421.1 putative permease, DMT superfamily [Zhouia amylolytica AD3]